jgi:hypothetical protein
LGITSFKASDKFGRLCVLRCVGFMEQSFNVGIVLNKLNSKHIDRVYVLFFDVKKTAECPQGAFIFHMTLSQWVHSLKQQ